MRCNCAAKCIIKGSVLMVGRTEKVSVSVVRGIKQEILGSVSIVGVKP